MNSTVDDIFNSAALENQEAIEVQQVVRKPADYKYVMTIRGSGNIKPSKDETDVNALDYKNHNFLENLISKVCDFFFQEQDFFMKLESSLKKKDNNYQHYDKFELVVKVYFDKRFTSVRRLMTFLTCFKLYLRGEYEQDTKVCDITLRPNTDDTKGILSEIFSVDEHFITNIHNFRRFGMTKYQLKFGELCQFLTEFTENDVDWYRGLCSVLNMEPDFSDMLIRFHTYSYRDGHEDISKTVHPFIRPALENMRVRLPEEEKFDPKDDSAKPQLNFVYIEYVMLEDIETLDADNGQLRKRQVSEEDVGRKVLSWKVIQGRGQMFCGYLGVRNKDKLAFAEHLVIAPEAGYSLKYEEYLDYDERCYVTENLIPLGIKKFTDAPITKKMINFGLYDKSADMKEDYNSRMKDLQSEIDDMMKEIQQERRYGW
jgi:hypothetical protein